MKPVEVEQQSDESLAKAKTWVKPAFLAEDIGDITKGVRANSNTDGANFFS